MCRLAGRCDLDCKTTSVPSSATDQPGKPRRSSSQPTRQDRCEGATASESARPLFLVKKSRPTSYFRMLRSGSNYALAAPSSQGGATFVLSISTAVHVHASMPDYVKESAFLAAASTACCATLYGGHAWLPALAFHALLCAPPAGFQILARTVRSPNMRHPSCPD